MGVNQAKDFKVLDQKFDFLKYKDFKSRYKVDSILRYYGVIRPGKT